MAEKIAARLRGNPVFAKVEIAGPGFINLRLCPEWLAGRLKDMAAGDRLGLPPVQAPRTIVVDFSSRAAAATFAPGAPSFAACSSIAAAFAWTAAVESFASAVWIAMAGSTRAAGTLSAQAGKDHASAIATTVIVRASILTSQSSTESSPAGCSSQSKAAPPCARRRP